VTVEATLDDAQVEQYRQDGFVALRHFFDPGEAAAWAVECDRLEALPAMFEPDNLRTHVLNSDRPPDRLDPVIDISPVLRAVAESPALTAVASRLLGDGARLFKDKVIFKPPGMKGYDAHQDYAYWHWLPAPASDLLTVLVALDPADTANGAVEFFPRLHRRQLTRPGSPADVDVGDLTSPGHVVETAPGDVVVFHSLTPHRSGENRSSRTRRQYYLSFNAARHGDLYRSYYDHLHQSMREAMPAEARERAFFR